MFALLDIDLQKAAGSSKEAQEALNDMLAQLN
jgi:hypothetical protein